MYLEDCQVRFQENTWRQKAFVYRNFLTFINDDPEAESITKQTFIEYLISLRIPRPLGVVVYFPEKNRKIIKTGQQKSLRMAFVWLTEI